MHCRIDGCAQRRGRYSLLCSHHRDVDRTRGHPEQLVKRIDALEARLKEVYGPEQLGEISRMIDAEKSDLFDVLAYIAFALPTITRAERAASRRAAVLSPYDEKLQGFLDFVLGQYVERGVEELSADRLPSLLELKYRAVSDATTQLGVEPKRIREAFVGFQRRLF